MLQKKAIALLITVFFIMAITISIGVALKYVKSASKSINSEQSMLQSSIILNDVLMMLKSSPAIEQINSPQGLAEFLRIPLFIPPSSGVTVHIEMSSARSKVNPNTLFNNEGSKAAFEKFLIEKMVNIEYAEMLYHVIGGIKADMSYNADVLTQKPNLFRGYLASYKHLQEINDVYTKKYHDNSLKGIDFEDLFYIGKEPTTYKVDLNYATPSTWQLMLGCNEDRANALSDKSDVYTLDLDFLSDEEILALKRFPYNDFEPYLGVKIEIIQKDITVNIRFEYNIKLRKGSNFVYEV